jgi:hypothetical protein
MFRIHNTGQWTGVQLLQDFGNITKKLLRILVIPQRFAELESKSGDTIYCHAHSMINLL